MCQLFKVVTHKGRAPTGKFVENTAKRPKIRAYAVTCALKQFTEKKSETNAVEVVL